MSILRSIMSRILGGSTPAAEAGPAATPAASTAQDAVPAPGPAEGGRLGGQVAPSTQPVPAPAPAPDVDVDAVLASMAARTPQRLDWRRSIVDLMKLLELDSSLSARKELAQELGYTGTLDGSAEMNLWLHRAVMRKLAEHGGRVPDDLRS